MAGDARTRGDEERSARCLACGLCCQGALHDLVPLDESPHRLAFRLPCPRLDDRRCTVYAERPRTCASYACETLRAYGAGEIDEAEALARVRAVGDLTMRIP